MPMQMHMTLTGMPELLKKLQVLKTGRNVIARAGLMAAARVVRDAIRDAAPEDSSTLKKSIGLQSWTNRYKSTVNVKIGPRLNWGRDITIARDNVFRQFGGKPGYTKQIFNPRDSALTMFRNPVKYAYFLEFGTKHRAPVPFMGPAGRSSQAAASAKFEEVVRERLSALGL